MAAEMALRRSNLRLQVAQRRRRAPRIEASGSGG
jgi:hypothetical protein